MTTREQRFFSGLEVREEKGPDTIGTITGYAAVFDKWSQDLGYFREKIRKGAFAKCLAAGTDVRALVGHDSRLIIGRRSAGTLKLLEDERGLKVEISVPDTTAGRDVLTSVRRKDLTGMSFAFDVQEDEWAHRTENGEQINERELIEVIISEVSVVAFPAYEETVAEARELCSPKKVLEDARARLGTDAKAARDKQIARAKALFGK